MKLSDPRSFVILSSGCLLAKTLKDLPHRLALLAVRIFFQSSSQTHVQTVLLRLMREFLKSIHRHNHCGGFPIMRQDPRPLAFIQAAGVLPRIAGKIREAHHIFFQGDIHAPI